MAIPKNKIELIEQSEGNFKKLMDYIHNLSKSELDRTFPEGYLNRNIRDVLGHIYHWHVLFLKWYEVGMAGNKPEIPATGYSWKDLPALNKEICKKYNSVPIHEVIDLLQDSSKRVHDLIKSHSNRELFEKGRYHWTGTTSLAVYLRGTASSHYNWGFKLIKKCMK